MSNSRAALVEQYRDVWRHAKSLTVDGATSEREAMIAGDVMRSAEKFVSEMQGKQLTPTKRNDLACTARHLEGMLARIETAVEGRAA